MSIQEQLILALAFQNKSSKSFKLLRRRSRAEQHSQFKNNHCTELEAVPRRARIRRSWAFVSLTENTRPPGYRCTFHRLIRLVRCRDRRDQLKRFQGLLPESQGQNLALTVLHVPYSLDSECAVQTALGFLRSARGVPAPSILSPTGVPRSQKTAPP